MVITVGIDIWTNMWFLVVALDAGSDGVSLGLRIGHGQWAGKKGMEIRVDVGLLL